MSKAILTIDDIGSKNTPAIVDYLCEKGIQAVMFAVGQNVERYYDETVYALQKGMIVGNHSYSHPGFSSLSLEECIEEIEKNEDILNKLYKDAGVERRYRPFRFPYGDKGGENYGALQEYFVKNGFDKLKDTQITYPWWAENRLDKDIDTFWTFDFGEYQIRPGSSFTKESVLARVHDEHPGCGGVLLEQGSHHIILFHAHDETEEMVPGYHKLFLDYVMAHGVEFEKPEFIGRGALHQALVRLKKYAAELCKQAGKDEKFLEEFWTSLCETEGMLREFAYYYDTQSFLCEKKIEGYSLADIMVWQVDHFKAYLDRGDDCLRYDSARLLLAAFTVMLQMEKNPQPYLEKMRSESGTDRQNPQC
ncbi:MAG: polysaccharide deacetylase family protein [Lachnospiraceae bacterium]